MSDRKEVHEGIEYVRIPESWLAPLQEVQLRNVGKRYIRDIGDDPPSPEG